MSKLPLASESSKKSNIAVIEKIIVPLIEDATQEGKYQCYVPLEYLRARLTRILQEAGYTVQLKSDRDGFGTVDW